jgi:hypothetical protein
VPRARRDVAADEAARVEVDLDDGQRRRREVGERRAAQGLGGGHSRLRGTMALVAAASTVGTVLGAGR